MNKPDLLSEEKSLVKQNEQEELAGIVRKIQNKNLNKKLAEELKRDKVQFIHYFGKMCVAHFNIELKQAAELTDSQLIGLAHLAVQETRKLAMLQNFFRFGGSIIPGIAFFVLMRIVGGSIGGIFGLLGFFSLILGIIMFGCMLDPAAPFVVWHYHRQYNLLRKRCGDKFIPLKDLRKFFQNQKNFPKLVNRLNNSKGEKE